MSCWVLSRFMNLIQVKRRSYAWNNYTSFFFLSHAYFLCFANISNASLTGCQEPHPAHPYTHSTSMPGETKEDKIQTQNVYFSTKKCGGGNGFCISGTDFCMELRKVLKRSSKDMSSQTERREILTYTIQQQSKNQHKLEWGKHDLGISRLKSSSRLCHQPCC